MDNVITRLCWCGQIAWRIAQFTGYDTYECPSGHRFDKSLNVRIVRFSEGQPLEFYFDGWYDG
jgi:hypothetical protein